MENQENNAQNKNAPQDKKPAGDLQPSPMKGVLVWVLILSVVVFILQLYVSKPGAVEEISYNPDFMKLVASKNIKECEIFRDASGNDYVSGELVTAQEGPNAKKYKKFKVFVSKAEDVQKYLSENNVNFKVSPQNALLLQMIFNALPVLVILVILYFLFARHIKSAGGGALSFGKSRAKLLSRDRNKVTFENVGGIDEAKEEVQEIIEFLKAPKRFQTLGGRIPKGVLLMGPPGTGKTLLAKAIAGEADVPFFSISGSDFVEMFVGVGASRVRDMFEQGKKNAPCIIFIDEIDAVGRSRFTGIGGSHDEREQTLNALLVEMDGFDSQEGIIIIAATNRPDVLDPALLRPGRFDRQIILDLPTIDGRETILKMHARKIKLDDKVTLRRIARGTPGFSGADLENLLNEAALLGARENKSAVTMKELEEARDKVRWGRERRSRVIDDKEKKVTAYHEAGHALVMELIDDSEPLHKITIIPRGAALGSTMQLPEKDRYMEGKKKLLGILVAFMGGRVAEEIVFTDITSGAASDLKEATRIARLMVCKWGMSEELGPQTFGEHQEYLFLAREVSKTQDYSEATAVRIDAEVNKILRDSYNRAKKLINENRDKLDMVANLLLERETLDGRDVEEIVEHGRLLTDQEREEIELKNKVETPNGQANGQPVKV